MAAVLLLPLVVLCKPISSAHGQHSPAEEIDRGRLVIANAALTGTFAVARGLIQGRLDDVADAGRVFAWGAAGGYGFYHAKRLVGRGYSLRGMGLAYLSTSIVENASRDRHPLGFLRLGIGPLDVRVRTPLARTDTTAVSMELNAVSVLNLALLPLFCCRPTVKDAVLLYRRHGELQGRRAEKWEGQALNRTIMLESSAGNDVFRHELIHLIQSLQFSAVTPYYRFSSVFPSVNRSLGRRSLRWDVQVDWLYLLVNTAFLAAPYEKRWAEREAYMLD